MGAPLFCQVVKEHVSLPPLPEPDVRLSTHPALHLTRHSRRLAVLKQMAFAADGFIVIDRFRFPSSDAVDLQIALIPTAFTGEVVSDLDLPSEFGPFCRAAVSPIAPYSGSIDFFRHSDIAFGVLVFGWFFFEDVGMGKPIPALHPIP